MDFLPLIAQFAGSLAAIVALYALARALRLGGDPRLTGHASVRAAANEVEDGFDAQIVQVSKDGLAALASNGDGRIMVLKRHGNRFAGRVLSESAQAVASEANLIVDCAESQFGKVALQIEQAHIWADRVNSL